MIRGGIILFLWVGVLMNSAVAKDTTRIRKITVLPVPTIGYAPETDFYFGAVTLFTLDLYQDSCTRTSNVDLEFNYTLRNQSILETSWNYFFREEKWFTEGLIHGSEYPDLYYGIGAQTREQDEVKFSSTRLNLQVNLYRKLKKSLFLGFGIGATRYNNIKSDSWDLPEELRSGSLKAVRIILLYDSRDRILTPRKGFYFKINSAFNFSQQDYPRVEMDIRKYYTGESGFTIAGRYYQSWVGNTPPFFDYPVMGGDQIARGYFYGRFRDRALSTIQAEIRTPQLYRTGLAFLGGVSALSPHFSLGQASYFPNFGIGLRFMVDKSETTNLRIDYAIGSKNQSGIYISFGESF